jgi:hypothetical protein
MKTDTLWNLGALALVISWTIMVFLLAYSTGYTNGRQDEQNTQTVLLKDIVHTLEERCR